MPREKKIPWAWCFSTQTVQHTYRLSQAGWDGLVVEKGAWIASESCLMVLLHVMWPAKVRITRGSPTSSASPIIHRLPVWASKVLSWGIQVSSMLHIEFEPKNAAFYFRYFNLFMSWWRTTRQAINVDNNFHNKREKSWKEISNLGIRHFHLYWRLFSAHNCLHLSPPDHHAV